MVSKWWTCPAYPRFCGEPSSIENLHRIQSLELCANFRRFNLNANTCDLSTAVSPEPVARSPQRERKSRPGSRDVFSAPHGILARAGARAVAQREDARIGKAAAVGGLRSRVRRVSGGVGHEPILQAAADSV